MPVQFSVLSGEAIDYDQYIKKVWIMKTWDGSAYNYSSFCISKIANDKIEGRFSTRMIALPEYSPYSSSDLYLGHLAGTIHNGVAKCQFSDNKGKKGNVTFILKTKDEIEATIQYTDKLQRYDYKDDSYKEYSLDGTFLFRPYNLKDIGKFSPIKDQCFTVNLNSWGTVNFLSGKLMGKHIPMAFYLTNQEGDILYDFGYIAPDNVNVKAVSFPDVNNDGLTDIIIILNINGGPWHKAEVLFQKTDGSFQGNSGLSLELNNSGNNKDIDTILEYLSKKF